MNKKRIIQASTFFGIVLWGCLIAWLGGVNERSATLGFIAFILLQNRANYIQENA